MNTFNRAGALHDTWGEVQQLEVPTAGCSATQALQLSSQDHKPVTVQALDLQQVERPWALLQVPSKLSGRAAGLA